MKKITIQILVLLFILQSCQVKEDRETVLDNISHVEDSIHYQIDSLSMLCDVLGMAKQYVDIGDCKLYCEVEGEGVPMVLINGGPGGTHHYFHPWFSEATDYCKIIYYDQRGCGQSDFSQGDGYTFRQAIDDLDKLRQKLGIQKWIVCGYSYGGGLAQYYTATYPQNVLGMVLIGSVSLLNDPLLNGTRQYDYISHEEKKKIDEIYGMYRKGEISFLQLMYNKDLNGDWKRQNFYKPTKEELIRGAFYEWINDKGFNRIMGNSYGRNNFRHVFDSCPLPTLLCEGKWDLTWTEDKRNIIKKNHPNAQFVLFENSGHSIYCDEPTLFFETIENFVASINPVALTDIMDWQKQVSKILGPQEKLIQTGAYFFVLIKDQGIEKASAYYNEFCLKNEREKLFSENGMNALGYDYLRKKEYKVAISLFEMNVDSYPDSWNVYDSLGEAYLASGNKDKAKENYKKSLALNPDNEAGKKVLKEL